MPLSLRETSISETALIVAVLRSVALRGNVDMRPTGLGSPLEGVIERSTDRNLPRRWWELARDG